MKRLITLLLVVVLLLCLVACDMGDAPTPSDSGNPDASQNDTQGDEQNDTAKPIENVTAWYRQGFQLSFEYDEFYGDMYCDGTSLWYIMHEAPRDGSPSYTQRFSVKPESDTSFRRLWHMNDGRPVDGKTYDGEALDYYFNRNLEYDNLGGLLNKIDNQFFNFQMYKKTEQIETVAGRSCTIYKMDSTEYERTISVDDEFGIVLKIRDTFYKSSNDGVYFEVTSILFGTATPPDDVIINE